MLFKKGQEAVTIWSPSIQQTGMLYISKERLRAKALTERLKTFEGVLVWGAGDNFHRCSENGGPLSNLPNMVVLDQHPQGIITGAAIWLTGSPAEGIRLYRWPVLITESVGRNPICQQVKEIDPSRQVFCL